MGWTFLHRAKGLRTEDIFRQDFGEGVLRFRLVGRSEAYMAYRTGKGPVIGLVCLTQYRSRDRCNFGYKDMDESMGPYYYNCPKEILEMLSPLEEVYALGSTRYESAKNWRDKCWENLNGQ